MQSAYDDGLLLLEHEAGDRKWNLWRLSQGRGEWYLSRWKDGAGPAVLWRGTKPAWLPSGAESVRVAIKPVDASTAWDRLDHESKKTAQRALDDLWMAAVTYHEASQASGARPQSSFRFPGRAACAFTPDGCARNKAGAAPWSAEPWRSLNFVPAEDAAWLGFDFLSLGEGPKARFLAIVAIDRECSGKTIHIWRWGKFLGDEVGARTSPR